MFKVDEDTVEMVTDEKLLAEEAKSAGVETGCLCLRLKTNLSFRWGVWAWPGLYSFELLLYRVQASVLVD